MSLVAKNFPALYNGVSQQPASMRLDTQLEAQENMRGTIVDGVGPRAGTEHVSTLSSTNITEGSFEHKINRDASEKYRMFLTENADEPIEVYDLSGSKLTVAYEEGSKDYLLLGEGLPKDKFTVVTVADHTFIANKTVTCAMLDDVTEGSVADSFSSMTDLPDGDTDTYGNGAYPAVGTIYEIKGDENSGFAKYYVKYAGGHAYEECVAPQIKYKLDPSTMPHAVVRQSDGTFLVKALEWENRNAGDEDTAPDPSFVGTTIKFMFFHRNRLSMLTEQNCILSAAADYYRFFPQTVVENLDDDPIDVGIGGNEVVSLQAAVEFDKALLLFSTMEQFALGAGEDLLTPSTAAVTSTTAYELVEGTVPKRAGANVYFPSPQANYLAMMEYFIQPDQLINDAANVTAHCPHYIPLGTVHMEISNVLDTLVVHTSGDPSALYVYKFYWMGTEKTQSAWGRWSFNGEILGMSLFGTDLHLTMKRGDEVVFEKMTLDTPAPFQTLLHPIHMDRTVVQQGTYDPATNMTTWTLPYEATEDVVVVNLLTGLMVPNISLTDSTTVQAVGDRSGYQVAIGNTFDSYFTLTTPYFRNQQKAPLLNDKMRLRTLTLAISDTAYFTVEYQSEGREVLTRHFSGASIGKALIGKVPLVSGEFRMPLSGWAKKTSITVRSSSYLPASFQSATLEMTLVRRSQAI